MSNTRHAAEGGTFRQERYASSEAYKTSLNGSAVANRVGLLAHDRELAELIWFLQDRSLHDHFLAGGRVGSVEMIASEVLAFAGWKPPQFQDVWTFVRGDLHREETATDRTETELAMVQELARELRVLALDPEVEAPAELPGLGTRWRSILIAYRAKCREQILNSLASTSAAKKIADALKFTRETGMSALILGRSRIGKSATAKAFAAASGGLVRYVLVPENADMESLYRAIARAVGAADATSYRGNDVRDKLEHFLLSTRLMLILDEAHNLFSGLRRVTRHPLRVMWLRKLLGDAGVPIAFVGLPEFDVRLERHERQLDWDADQFKELIARREELPATLEKDDFRKLIERLGPDLSASAQANLLAGAITQHGAQYVVHSLAIARKFAAGAGREKPSAEDVALAVGERPKFPTGAPTRRPRKKEVEPRHGDGAAKPAAGGDVVLRSRELSGMPHVPHVGITG